MKTIIYTGPFRFPTGDAAAARVLNNAKILREIGYTVIFLSWGGEYQECDKDLNGNYWYQGFQYIITDDIRTKELSLPKRISNHFLSGKNALNLINQICDKNTYGIIVYNPTFYFTNKLLCFCKKNKNIKLIADITEFYEGNELPGGKYGPTSILNELTIKYVLKHVNNKIVISSFLCNYYKYSNNLLLPPLVDLTENKWENRLSEQGCSIKNDGGIKILYAGTPGKKDLLTTMLSSISNILDSKRQIHFYILGVSESEINDQYNIFENYHHIHFLGKVKQEQVPAYYKTVDFSLILREDTRKSKAGFPTKLVESISAGTPVITNLTSDINKYINDGINGIIVKDSTKEELINTLNHIMTLSDDQILTMKENCKNTGIHHFDFPNYIAKMSTFLNNATNENTYRN